MAATVEDKLSRRQELVLSLVEEMILSAVSARCAGCSTANFAPRRIGSAVARDRISQETAIGIARRFSACSGLAKVGGVEMCHYPPSTC